AIAPPLRAQTVLLSGPHPEDPGVGRRDRQVTDGLDAESLGRRLPRDAAVDGLPDAATRCADVHRLGIGRAARHRERGHASAVGGRTQVAICESFEEPGERVFGRRGRVGSGRGGTGGGAAGGSGGAGGAGEAWEGGGGWGAWTGGAGGGGVSK